MNANILIKANATESLDAFVASLSDSLGRVHWEERQSVIILGSDIFAALFLPWS